MAKHRAPEDLPAGTAGYNVGKRPVPATVEPTFPRDGESPAGTATLPEGVEGHKLGKR